MLEILMGNAGDVWNQILTLIITIVIILNFMTDLPQRAQTARYSRSAAQRLAQLEALVLEGKRRAARYLAKLGAPNSYDMVEEFSENFFRIQPVEIEPTDIIRRLDHIIRTQEKDAEAYVKARLSGISDAARRNAMVTLSIAGALHTVYKVLRHYYLIGRKYDNWVLLMQLSMLLPQYLKELVPYVKAIDAIMQGVPIGDGVGPMVANMLLGLSERREVVEDTVVGVTEVDGRRVYVIKAAGPGANVGKPGKAVAKVADELGCRITRIITVDAALKLEGEETGTVSEGAGAAIGDPGPEKIEIERTAVRCRAPLDAVIVKMSNEEAITAMKREIAEAARKAYEQVLRIIRSRTRPGDNVIVVGIGNTLGVW